MFRRILLLGKYRELILNFVLRDVKEKYRGTLLGYLWTLVTPLMIMGVFILIFTYVFPVDIPMYPLYLLTGFLSWNSFYASISESTWSIRSGGELLKKVYFPPEVFPVSVVLTNLITLCLSLLVLVPFLLAYQVAPTWRLWFLPGIILWQTLFCCGLGMITALLYVYFRDTGPLVGTALNLWFYATPIFYSTDFMSEGVRTLYYLNPTAVMVGLYRWAILGLPPPSAGHLGGWAVLSMVLPLAGFWVYKEHGNRVAKVL